MEETVKLLRLAIVGVPTALGSLMLVDALYRIYLGVEARTSGRHQQLTSEAAQLCDRLVDAERQAFSAYLQSPDADSLQSSKQRLERIRNVGQKADVRQKRRQSLTVSVSEQ